MLLIVGLGNPGEKYTNNRHNVGFMVVDDIAHHHGFSPWRAKFKGLLADGTIDGEKVLLLKPMTFMNRSGQSVSELMRFYKLSPNQVVVFHDELDLARAKLRIKTGGGHGGNNGVRDIASHIGPDFKRVRMGVGHPGNKDAVQGHLLSDFAKADKVWLDPLIDECARGLPFLIKGEDDKYMTQIALHLQSDDKNNKSDE
jgi:PTH1 family peptidyl-tRNA hydrolase